MPAMGYPLQAYLVIDNNAIANLCEYYCDRHKQKPFSEMMQSVCDEVSAVFKKIKCFALNGKIITTDCVQDEFKPENGVIRDYPGFSPPCCDRLKAHIRGEIEAFPINMMAINRLRALPQAPSRFGEKLGRLSDPDLSLAILALGIADKFKQRVYILTDEEDLRSFISWMKPKAEVKTFCSCPQQIEALHSLIYMDCAHRTCAFPTDLILSLLNYATIRQMARVMLFGTSKGEMITQTYKVIYDAVKVSQEVKRQHALGGVNP